MKSRSPDEQAAHGLPPPPAPTARDANPWQISSPPDGVKAEPRRRRALGRAPTPGSLEPRHGRRPRSSWIPLLMLFAVVGTGMEKAIQAFRDGDVETALGALVVFAVVAAVALRRLLKQRSD
jgi:hypothetical protein